MKISKTDNKLVPHRLYTCNVIADGISKRAIQTRFLGNYKIYNTPFLRSTHLLEAHRICQVISKNRKLVWWKLSKRPIRYRQMPMPIFPWQRTQHINVWRMVGGGNLPTLTGLWLTVRVGNNVETKSRT